jgi:hypothetical protein
MNLLANPISAFRKKRQQVDLTMDSLDDTQAETASESKLTSGYTPSQNDEIENKCQKFVKKTGYFFLVLAIISGAIAMMYLPFILLSPTKFCLLFSFSLTSSAMAILCLKGKSYIKSHLLSGSVKYYTTTLVLANILGLGASFRDSGAIICLVMAIVQFIALTYVLFARLNHGKEFLDGFYGGIGNFFRGLCLRTVRRTN